MLWPPPSSRTLSATSRLCRPALLLEGQRLQVVVLPRPKESKCSRRDTTIMYQSTRYKGLWHVRGEIESVVDTPVGGNMELLDRHLMAGMWCEEYEEHRVSTREHMRSLLCPTGTGLDASGPPIPNFWSLSKRACVLCMKNIGSRRENI
jgi:hypothetical protein